MTPEPAPEPTPEALRARYAARLRAEMEELLRASSDTAASRRPVELDQQAVGRLSRMDAMQGQAMAAAGETRRQGQITATRAALARLDGEDFGCCSSCGAFIGLARLDLDPRVQGCIGCAGGGRR
ncbi:MAG: TraR/DksA family transcriptional regulator [Phaeovulum sp.]|uniref:TraR/DksA family transcriptional regulator n=1 Tax=Phaeovulum sp. TaxID=2934796 RepID=UPI0027302991|nr:TraR/DksA family transcriptional regulator [Phaeovulum sp.]MDP2063240.1 TraR/DksA family transcriptional regulator [Phaeovulum sp.]